MKPAETQHSFIMPDASEIHFLASVEPGTPARTNCLPEDAYPSEPATAEIGECWFEGVGRYYVDPSDWFIRAHGKMMTVIEAMEIQAIEECGS